MRGDGSSILVVEGDASLVDILGEINDFSGFVGLEIGNGATITVTSQVEIDILAKIGAVFGSGTLSINGAGDLPLSEVTVIDGFAIAGSNSNLSNVSIVDGTFSLEQGSMTNINTDGINLVGASTTTAGFSIDENGQLFITDTSLTGRQLIVIEDFDDDTDTGTPAISVIYAIVLPELDTIPTQEDFDSITFSQLDEGANLDLLDALSTTLPNLDSGFVLTKIIANNGTVNGFSYNSGDFFGTDIITFTLTNVANGEEFDFTADLSITAVNDAPIIGGIIPTDITITEDMLSNIDLSTLEFADIDGDDLTVTLTASTGSFVGGQFVGVTISRIGANTLILTGSVSDINAYFDIVLNILYSPPSNITGDDAATITIVANDGLVDSLASTINIDIIAVNDAGPTISGIIPTDITVIEDTASNIDLSLLEFSDIDGDNLTVTLTASTGTFTVFIDGETTNETNLFSVSGTASELNTYFDTASNIQYIGESNITGDDAATFTIIANDGAFDSSINTVNLDIIPINIPVIGGTIPTDISIIEDIAIDIDLSSLEFTNINEDNLTVTLTVSTGTFAGVDGIAGVTVSGTGTSELILTGNISDIHTYLDTASNIEYTGASNVYGNNAATFTITANNGILSSELVVPSIVNLDIGRFLVGTSGNDTIVGTSAGDIIEGLAGRDNLIGGSGADRFVYTDADIGVEEVDTIADFDSGIDKIDLSGVSGLSSVPDFMISDVFINRRVLLIDINSDGHFDGSGDIEINFSNGTNIVEGDFLL